MFKKKILGLFIIFLMTMSLVTSTFATINADYPDRVDIDGKLSDTTLTLTWSKSTDPNFKRYHIIESETDTHPEYLDEEPTWSTDDINETSYQVKNLKEEAVYYFRVCVNNTSNRSTCSNIIHINRYNMVKNFPIYQDINSDAWYKRYVDDLQDKIILPLYDRSFEPGKNITRREFVEWLVRAIADEDIINPKTEYFCDVTFDDKYINYLKELDVVEGYHGGSCASRKVFKPNQTINRAEALKVLLEVFKVRIQKSTIDYAINVNDSNIAVDVNQKQWFAKYIYWAQKDGVVDTNPNGYFRPETPLNRAEAAKILSKAIAQYK